MAEIKSLLDEVIEAEIAYVGSLSPGDEKKSKAIQQLADLHKLRIDEIKAKTDADEKRLRRAMDSKQHRAELNLKERQADGDETARTNEEQFKQHQLNDQVIDRYSIPVSDVLYCYRRGGDARCQGTICKSATAQLISLSLLKMPMKKESKFGYRIIPFG